MTRQAVTLFSCQVAIMSDVLAQSRNMSFADEQSHIWDCCGCACCIAQHIPATTNVVVGAVIAVSVVGVVASTLSVLFIVGQPLVLG